MAIFQPVFPAHSRRGRRNQDQDRPFPYFQARRCSQSHHQQATAVFDRGSCANHCASAGQARGYSRAAGDSDSGSESTHAPASGSTEICSSDFDSQADFYGSGTTSAASDCRTGGATDSHSAPASSSAARGSGGYDLGSGCSSAAPSSAAGTTPGDGGPTGRAQRVSSAAATNDRSANRAPPGVQGSYAAGPARRAAGSSHGSHDASRAGTSGARTTNFPAPATRCADESPATASGRAQANASYAPVTDGITSVGGWSWSCARRRTDTATREPAGSAVTPAGTALCAPRCEGRPDEGLHAAAAAVAFQ